MDRRPLRVLQGCRMLALAALVVAMPLAAHAEGLFNDVQFRIEFGGGAQGGDPDIDFAGTSGSLETGTGFILGGGVWADRIAWEHLSFGVQYLRFDNSDFDQTGTAAFLGTTFTGNIKIEPTIDAFMFNAAVRKNDSWWHPYVSLGIGVARTAADISANGTVTVSGTAFTGAGSTDDNSTNFAGQVAGGIDFDIGDSFYVGGNGRYFATNGSLFGADVDFRSWAFMAVAGVRF